MKRIGFFILFISAAILLAVGISEITGLSLRVSALISVVAAILFYLILDLRPESKSSEATIIRLTKGSWYKKK